MSTFLWDNIVFGPIKSRRLGQSLGINVSPIKFKACTFDCIYCECGWSRDLSELPPGCIKSHENILTAIEQKLHKCAKEQIPIDSITFSGNGEPTLHPNFDLIIEGLLPLRDKYYPKAVISCLTNATFIANTLRKRGLKKIDKVILKLDAANEEQFKLVNRPMAGLTLEDIITEIANYDGNFILQTLFLKGETNGVVFDTSESSHVQEWLGIVKKLQPKEVMIYSLDRETPEKALVKVSQERLEEIAEQVRQLGIAASVY